MKDRHAYLIMTHGNFEILKLQLEMLDDSRNDIYIHVDKKVKNFDFLFFRTYVKKAHIEFTKKRINVRWGGQTLVLAELLLFKEASTIEHCYYHLISGVDIPLHSQDYIHNFFREDRNYIICRKEEELNIWDYQRLSRFHFPSWIDVRILGRINILQEKFNVDRLKKYNFEFTRGYEWCSLTHEAVRYLISKEKFIVKITRRSSCADEVYKQLLLYNSEYKETIYKDENGDTDDLRLVDWKRKVQDSSHIFTSDDYDMIVNSKKLFARKFDEKTDINIVIQLHDRICEEQKVKGHL